MKLTKSSSKLTLGDVIKAAHEISHTPKEATMRVVAAINFNQIRLMNFKETQVIRWLGINHLLKDFNTVTAGRAWVILLSQMKTLYALDVDGQRLCEVTASRGWPTPRLNLVWLRMLVSRTLRQYLS